jgi:nucleoside 2-deoxyribosyltransferase
MDTRPVCFFIMPFNPASNFFYQYLKEHIENDLKIKCERADQSGGQGTLIEKLINHIQKADLIIVDCSGGNSNVMFELGIAYNAHKNIVYITKDDSRDFPSDLKLIDFLNYATKSPKEFLESIESALTQSLSGKYDSLYEKAKQYQMEFNIATKSDTHLNSKEKFIELVESAREIQRVPDTTEEQALKQFLLPRIIKNSEDSEIMKKIVNWTS